MEIVNDRPPISTPNRGTIDGHGSAGLSRHSRSSGDHTGPQLLYRCFSSEYPHQIPTLIYGPGDDRFAHQPDECISVDAYVTSIHFYYHLAKKYGQMVQT